MVGEFYPTYKTDLYCFDCECILNNVVEIANGRCGTCSEHIVDMHAPVKEKQIYCHGAGPEGKLLTRLEQLPRALGWTETKASTW